MIPGVFLLILVVLSTAGTLLAATEAGASASPSTTTKQGLIPPPRRDVPGKRTALTTGTLFVPDYYRAKVSSGTEIVIFFHGAAWCAEQNFYDARKNAVLVSISLPMDKYTNAFATSGSLNAILEEVGVALHTDALPSPPITRVCLASFSGGYSAVRELLRTHAAAGQAQAVVPVLPEREKQVAGGLQVPDLAVNAVPLTDVVLADSLYAPRVEGSTETLNSHAMAPFLAYSRPAAEAGGPTFIFTHLYPPEEQYRGNTTTLAATYLLNALGIPREPASGTSSRGARLLYRARRHNFLILGYAGMTTQDHFEHFYGISDALKRTSLTPAIEQAVTTSSSVR